MIHAEVESPTMLPGDSLVPLESILCTEELNRRPSRAPDYQADKCPLVALAQALTDSPRTILQTMAEKMLEIFHCDSAGFSLLTKDGKNFYWPAIAGMWQPHIGGGTPARPLSNDQTRRRSANFVIRRVSAGSRGGNVGHNSSGRRQLL